MTYKTDNLSVLVFTDLDSSFLSKSNFSFGNNLNMTKQLFEEGHFVIFNSSKTFIELKNFSRDQSLDLPFICENGGGIYSPKTYFKDSKKKKDGYSVIFETKNIENKISSLKEEIIEIYGKYLTFFKDLDDANKKKLSGLSSKGIKLALDREFTELILWQSNDENLFKFKEYLDLHDLKIIKGGRFHHISNNINKGISMNKLVNQYKKYYSNKDFITIAIGDSDNDFEMLNYADYPCIVKSSDNQNFVEILNLPIYLLAINKRLKVGQNVLMRPLRPLGGKNSRLSSKWCC